MDPVARNPASPSLPRRIARGLAVSAIATALCLLALEAAARALYAWRMRPAARPFAAMQLDERLGWRPTPQFTRRGERVDAAGTRYAVEMNVDAGGFRRYRAESPRGRLLVVGDSFTWAVDAGDTDTYYGRLHRRLGVDVDAFGCGGYSSLQEAMVLEEQVGRVRPSLVLWQACRNDFYNNSYELETRSRFANNGMRRPYLDARGRLYYALPGGFPRALPGLRDFANRRSKLLYFAFSRMDQLGADRAAVDEPLLRGDAEAIRLFDEAVAITRLILRRAREHVPAGIPVALFAIDDDEPYRGIWERLCAEAGIVWIDGVGQAVRAAQDRGEPTVAGDGMHWNPRGHAIAADVLAPALEPLLPR